MVNGSNEIKINFGVAFKKIQQEGTLAWEYNPFRNYRLDEDMIYFQNKFYSVNDFALNYLWSGEGIFKSAEINDGGIIVITYYKNESKTDIDTENINTWLESISSFGEVPVFYQKGQLVDFITDEFNFDLNHPVQITPAYSYDNSVDLIINDGKNSPTLINSRFSAIGKNKYKIVDRNGINDTNIYDRGEQFAIDTSLYKVTKDIPKIEYKGVSYGGNLNVGNYFFYFKYCDLDGNESDFVGQSGLVSLFLGNTPDSINSGFGNQNSNKKIRFIISNNDSAYDYLIVYYSRITGEELQERVTSYVQIDQKFQLSSNKNIIDITGFEDSHEITMEELNQRLQVYTSAKTQAISQNMLFLGNVEQDNQNHETLSRLALYIIPSLNTEKECEIDKLNDYYSGDITNTYYNPEFIYNYTGYWEDELYRFGVVFIRNNNTLTPVYSIRGMYLNETSISDDSNEIYDKTKFPLHNDENALKLVTYSDVDFTIDADFIISKNNSDLENAAGVCYIPQQDSLLKVIGIRFECPKEIISKLRDLGIKGYIIVRQKRIPTTLCQAYTIGIETQSHTPVLPVEDGYLYESFVNKDKDKYYYWNDSGSKKTDTGYLLSNDFDKHKRVISYASPQAAICPDYDVNSAYLNNLFTGDKFTITTQYEDNYLVECSNERHYKVNTLTPNVNSNLKYNEIKVIGVEDSVKLVGINEVLFSACAGDSEEVHKYEYVGNQIKEDGGGNNIIRGVFGNYLGITGYDKTGSLITIKIPGYSFNNIIDYIKMRCTDASEFYPISDYLTFDEIDEENPELLGIFYRGDCYICKFTHRLNRNFTDSDTPTNDIIVDPSGWSHNIVYEDEVLKTENLENINKGDVNAVNLGMWVTFILRSDINHSVRSVNESYTDEMIKIGHGRGFYPYHPISAKSGYKLPETGTYNKGFGASVGEQVFFELSNVPYYKDIFSTRIAYSNIQISSAFKNAYRVFVSGNYRDYPITYGEITKLIEWNGDIMCILEHGVYKIPVNERTLAGDGSGGSVYINTNNVLPENPLVISDTFGSQWIDSIIKTSMGIYGVDTVAKKIWRVDGNGMELISDFKVQEFLNNNITLTERELTPVIGIRNVKTHYNAFKKDVMFTFYDDLHGVDEVAWNLCWNETQNLWTTFYSWIPSFSENIYNQYFSFDRNTSKQIANLVANDSEYIETINLSEHKMTDKSNAIGQLSYDANYEGNDITISYTWEILKDPYGNYKYFAFENSKYDPDSNNNSERYISKEENPTLYYTEDYSDYSTIVKLETLQQETYEEEKETTSYSTNIKKWKQSFDELKEDANGFTKQISYQINIRVSTTITYNSSNVTAAEYVSSKNLNNQLSGGYIERSVVVIPEEHLEALSTDFWKHGQSGIIDIKEEIKPTVWYGKQHPFEFEFIVRDQADAHKIFDNLIIISNKAEPESFHYEIVGECYEFAEDKKNMYIRQEATKELFQNEGFDISYNDDYKTLTEEHRKIIKLPDLYKKSTIFPLYYKRVDKLNTIEDYYHQRPGEHGKDFSNMSGSEIVYYKNLNEFRIWTHSKAVNMIKKGRLRGNMLYKEDKWNIQIPSINFVQNNEEDWNNANYRGEDISEDKIPIELAQANFVDAGFIKDTNNIPDGRGYVLWDKNNIRHQEARIKDKYVKIRIRYSGTDLAVISAIKTMYSISYA